MTTLEAVFHYGRPPGETEMRALQDVRKVYGIRQIGTASGHCIRVEYDASRLGRDDVAALLREAGIELCDPLIAFYLWSTERMSDRNSSESQDRIEQRKKHGQELRSRETTLHDLATAHEQQEFFRQVIPLLGALRRYISRRLRIAYLDQQLRTEGVRTSADIVDEVVLSAYESFGKKPKELTLEQWLYQLANQKLERYVKRTSTRDAKRRSLESLARKEGSAMEERMTADAEGEPMLEEDLYDNEYHLQPEFLPPSYVSDPSEVVEKKEELEQIVRALSRIPQNELIVFELSAIEGFSNDEVSKITGTPASEVSKIVQNVRSRVLQQLDGADDAYKRAS